MNRLPTLVRVLRENLDTLGVYKAPAYFATISIVACVPLPIGGIFSALIALSGFLFGLYEGFIIAYAAAIIGANVAFAIGRRVGKSSIGEWARGELPRGVRDIECAIGEGGFSTLLVLRLTPLPVALSSMLLGSAPSVDAGAHFGATALGFLRLAANVYVGASAQEAMSQDGPGAGTAGWVRVGGALATIVAIAQIARSVLRRNEERRTKGK